MVTREDLKWACDFYFRTVTPLQETILDYNKWKNNCPRNSSLPLLKPVKRKETIQERNEREKRLNVKRLKAQQSSFSVNSVFTYL